MLNTASSPLDPYVRLILDVNNDYVLQVMFNVPQECLPSNGPSVDPYSGREDGTTVQFVLDPIPYKETGNCSAAFHSVVVGNLDDTPAPTGKIIVVAAWDRVGSSKGPETPGKTLIQFEDALDQRD